MISFIDERPDHQFFDRDGRSISFPKWSELRVQINYCRVAIDQHVGTESGDCEVVTSWTGVNVRPTRGGQAPFIFETLVFGGAYNLSGTAYHTQDQAQAGHARVVEDLRAGRKPWWAEG